MIKKIEYAGIALLVILFIAIILKVVDRNNNVEQEAFPIDYVEAYFNEMQKGNFKRANWFYDKENEENLNSLMKEEYLYRAHWALYGVTLEDEQIEKDTAKVKVTVNKKNHVDAMLNVKRRLLELVDNNEVTDANLEMYKKKFILEELTNPEVEVVTNTYNINLIKNENNEWKIVNDNVIKDILFGTVSDK